jgi:hypothetical protein
VSLSIEEQLISYYDDLTADLPINGPGLPAAPMVRLAARSATDRRSRKFPILIGAAAAIIVILVLVRIPPRSTAPTAPQQSRVSVPQLTPSTAIQQHADSTEPHSPPSAAAPPVASCAADALLPIVAGLFPANSAWNPTTVNVEVCQAGFVQLVAVMNQEDCPTPGVSCRDDPKVWLQDVDGIWTYLATGTGIGCSQGEIRSPTIEAACMGLGLAVSSTT